MTLPGGAADKLGNRYETWWTLSELVRMLRGKTEAIRIEDLRVEAFRDRQLKILALPQNLSNLP